MSGTPVTRRSFLAALVAAMGAAIAGVAVGWTRSNDEVAAVATTSTNPTTATQPPASSSTTAQPTTTANTTTTTPSLPAQQPIDVLCRESWGASPRSGTYTPHTINQITVHHTAVLLAVNSDAPARARQHQKYHQSLDWPDLAYHYLIDRNGHIYEGRPVDFVGDTATNYDPTGHFLVCCEGNFDEQEVAAEQFRSLVRLVAWGAVEFDVDPATISGHRDLATTSCPGDNLYSLVADGTVAADVIAAVANAQPMLNVLCGSAGAELVAAIEDGSV